MCNLFAKLFADIVETDIRVLYHIVQYSSGDGLMIKLKVVDNFCNRQAVNQVGFAGSPGLVTVGFFRAIKRGANHPLCRLITSKAD